MKKQRGFSLIELLIVVAIILIIAAIAIPNLLRARIAANEASAVKSVRTVDTAEVAYAAAYPSIGYAPDLKTLGPGASCTVGSTCAQLLDSVLGCTAGTGGTSCPKSGYNILLAAATTVNGQVVSYVVTADPISQGQTGQRHFYSGTPGFINFNTSAIANSTDAVLQ